VTAVLSDSTHHCALWQAVPGFKMSVVEVEFYMMVFDMRVSACTVRSIV
jgi:hypothetical protein